ncbi:MAG: peptidylprolyl isomerase [Actinomycetota bacterium]|nr:peptidylprolyl isomerase [Actinomycetota bacterium]
MAGNKRQRELARAKFERQQSRRARQGGRRRRNQRIIAAVVVVGLVLGSVAWAILATRGSEVPTAEPTIDPSAFASLVASAEAQAEAAALDCLPPGTPRADDLSFASAPANAPGASLTLATNCGDIVIALDPAAPATVASAAFLAGEGFYDATSCHRLTTSGIFVLQCGDPKGDGTGGPGYVLPDENLPVDGEANYPAGTVAMANAGPGTSGSQFFIVYDDTTLPGDYTIWGTVTEGLDLVREIASAGVVDGATDGAPVQPVFIESATVQS